jgi:fucose 4-O-acetylase-like acetyltransferase
LTSFYINALLGIGAVLLVASLLPTNRVARWLGENTIVIFPLHLLAFGVITSVAMFGFHVDKDFKDDSVTWSLFYTIAAIGLCLVCAPVFRWCLPWAIGLPGRPVSGEALTRASTPCDATRHTGLGERLPVRNAPARH